MNLDSSVLLGWLLATSIVVTYACEFEQYKLNGLVAVDNSLFPFSGDDWNHHRGKNFNVQNWHNVYMPLFYNPEEFYSKFFQRIGVHDEDKKWITEQCRLAAPWSCIELHYDFCLTDNVSRLKKITVPAAFFGADSKDYGLDMVEKFASEVSGYSEVVKFYESGHLMFLYESEKFDTELARFLTYSPQLKPGDSGIIKPALF